MGDKSVFRRMFHWERQTTTPLLKEPEYGGGRTATKVKAIPTDDSEGEVVWVQVSEWLMNVQTARGLSEEQAL